VVNLVKQLVGTPYLTRQPIPNVQVSFDQSPDNARSESSLVVNPKNYLNMVGASKRFTDPSKYQFSLVAYASHNGGLNWQETLLVPPGSDFTSDPTVTYDDVGNAYVMGMMWHDSTKNRVFSGLAVYKSTDGGATWSNPNVIYTVHAPDKQTIAGDMTPSSPHHGNLYAAWDSSNGLEFGRSKDHGATWIGLRQAGVDQAIGSQLVTGGVFASISVAASGKVYIFYLVPLQGGSNIDVITSSDGGDTFSAPATVVTGLTVVPDKLPGGQFRLETIPTSCVSGTDVVVAWPDFRNSVSQVFYRRSNNAGATWLGPGDGDLLTASAPTPTGRHDFMPQLAAVGNEIGCCFCEFGPHGGKSLIEVVTVVSTDSGATFDKRLTVTDQPWDPTIDAPIAGGTTRFIGDYFGFAAGPTGFFPFWTDTRTGIQEIFTSRVFLTADPAPFYATWMQILFGVVEDGGGIAIVGGHIVRIPPRGPEIEMLNAIVVAEAAKSIPGAEGKTARKAALRAVVKIATKAATIATKAVR